MKPNRITLCTVEVLKLVPKRLDGITLDEICAKLDMPKTSTYDIVTILVQTGMIHVAREQKQRYTIGLTTYWIGINYTNNLDFTSTTDPTFKAFSKEVGKTVLFGIRPDDSIVYIRKFEPENPVTATMTVEAKSLICCISLGKTIVVYTGDEDRDGVLPRISLKECTNKTVCIRGESERELEPMREKEYAFDARELEGHMGCMGAPVSGQDGNVIGAISVSSLYRPTEDYDTLGCLVSDKGARLSYLLGYIRHV